MTVLVSQPQWMVFQLIKQETEGEANVPNISHAATSAHLFIHGIIDCPHVNEGPV